MMNSNFDRFCDRTMAAGILQQLPLFAQNRYRMVDCRILRTRLKIFKKAHRSFLNVCYEVKFNDLAGSETRSEILLLRAFCDGRSEIEFQQHQTTGDVYLLPEMDAIVYRFPCDPKLPQLAVLLDPETVMRHLPFPGLPPAVAAPELIKKIDIRIAHYYPEHRCTAKYMLHSTLHGEHQPVAIYGKIFRDSGGQQTNRNLLVARVLSTTPGRFLNTKTDSLLPQNPYVVDGKYKRDTTAGNVEIRCATGHSVCYRQSIAAIPHPKTAAGFAYRNKTGFAGSCQKSRKNCPFFSGVFSANQQVNQRLPFEPTDRRE